MANSLVAGTRVVLSVVLIVAETTVALASLFRLCMSALDDDIAPALHSILLLCEINIHSLNNVSYSSLSTGCFISKMIFLMSSAASAVFRGPASEVAFCTLYF